MRAGDLRHLITIQKNTPTADGMGGQTSVWATLTTAWAAIWPISAREQVANQQIEGRITHKIRIRYQENITGANRVILRHRCFKLIGPPINIDERNRTLDLLCLESESDASGWDDPTGTGWDIPYGETWDEEIGT